MRMIGGLLFVFAGAAFAAQQSDRTGQLTEVQQISNPGAAVPAAPAAARTSEASPQLTGERRGSAGSTQLATGSRSAASSPQLTKGAPTALPPPPLSTAGDGRTAVVDRVKGEDRCDPRAERKGKAAECAAIIENRAAAFQRNEPPELSPEQKIILEQTALEKRNLDAAARRLANSGDDADSIEAQGVAFIVLRPAPREEEKPADKPSEAEAAAAAAVNAILNPAAGPQQ